MTKGYFQNNGGGVPTVLCGFGNDWYIKNCGCGSHGFKWVGEPICMGGIPMVLSELGNQFYDGGMDLYK